MSPEISKILIETGTKYKQKGAFNHPKYMFMFMTQNLFTSMKHSVVFLQLSRDYFLSTLLSMKPDVTYLVLLVLHLHEDDFTYFL